MPVSGWIAPPRWVGKKAKRVGKKSEAERLMASGYPLELAADRLDAGAPEHAKERSVKLRLAAEVL